MSRLPVLAFALTACAAPPKPTPREVVGVGFATGIQNVSLARSTAENRARAAVARMLAVDAVTFRLASDGAHQTLELVVPGVEVEGAVAELAPVAGGWMAKVRALRPDAVVASMQALKQVRGRGTARHEDPARAYDAAERRAFGAALQSAIGGAGRASGSLSVLSLDPTFADGAVTVDLVLAVRVGERAPLGPTEASAIEAETLAEHEALGELDLAIAALERGGDGDPARRLRLAELCLKAGRGARAGELFYALYQADKNDKSLLERAKAALKTVPEAERTSAIVELIRTVERELAARSGLPYPG